MTTFAYTAFLRDSSGDEPIDPMETDFDHANLECSRNEDGTHSLILDLDCPHEYRPSSTAGHGHLIVHARMPWESLLEIFTLLSTVGVIEDSWVKHTKENGAAYVRRAGIKKSSADFPG